MLLAHPQECTENAQNNDGETQAVNENCLECIKELLKVDVIVVYFDKNTSHWTPSYSRWSINWLTRKKRIEERTRQGADRSNNWRKAKKTKKTKVRGRKEREEGAKENAIHEARLASVEQTMKQDDGRVWEAVRGGKEEDRLDHAEERRQIL